MGEERRQGGNFYQESEPEPRAPPAPEPKDRNQTHQRGTGRVLLQGVSAPLPHHSLDGETLPAAIR